jgi:hypothetical protein
VHAPAALRRACLDGPSEEFDALAHPHETNSGTIGFRRGDNSSLIGDGHVPAVGVSGKKQVDTRGPWRVAQNIGERLLHHTIERESQARIGGRVDAQSDGV